MKMEARNPPMSFAMPPPNAMTMLDGPPPASTICSARASTCSKRLVTHRPERTAPCNRGPASPQRSSVTIKRPDVRRGRDKDLTRPSGHVLGDASEHPPLDHAGDNFPCRSALHMSAHSILAKNSFRAMRKSTVYHVDIDRVHTIDCDYLVVGAGVAGLRAAIELAEAGSVLVVAKDSLRESSSEYAQGGIAAALSDDDEVELHEQDTMIAGAGLCDREAVRILVQEGPGGDPEVDRVGRRVRS